MVSVFVGDDASRHGTLCRGRVGDGLVSPTTTARGGRSVAARRSAAEQLLQYIPHALTNACRVEIICSTPAGRRMRKSFAYKRAADGRAYFPPNSAANAWGFSSSPVACFVSSFQVRLRPGAKTRFRMNSPTWLIVGVKGPGGIVVLEHFAGDRPMHLAGEQLAHHVIVVIGRRGDDVDLAGDSRARRGRSGRFSNWYFSTRSHHSLFRSWSGSCVHALLERSITWHQREKISSWLRRIFMPVSVNASPGRARPRPSSRASWPFFENRSNIIATPSVAQDVRRRSAARKAACAGCSCCCRPNGPARAASCPSSIRWARCWPARARRPSRSMSVQKACGLLPGFSYRSLRAITSSIGRPMPA